MPGTRAIMRLARFRARCLLAASMAQWALRGMDHRKSVLVRLLNNGPLGSSLPRITGRKLGAGNTAFWWQAMQLEFAPLVNLASSQGLNTTLGVWSASCGMSVLNVT